MKNGAEKGFTLIELMIVVAIIGTLAAIAMPVYQGFSISSRMVKVQHHFEESARFTKNQIRTLQADLALGRTSYPKADLSGGYTEAGYIALLNAWGGTAPDGGGQAFASTPDDAIGVVGVNITGTLSSGDWVVTITRPQYGEYAEQSAAVQVITM